MQKRDSPLGFESGLDMNNYVKAQSKACALLFSNQNLIIDRKACRFGALVPSQNTAKGAPFFTESAIV